MKKVKKKSFYGVIIVVLTVIAASLAYGIHHFQAQSSEFMKNGYILCANGQAEAQKISFAAGTDYRSQGKDQIALKDIQKKESIVNKDSFVHYEDGSMNALDDGVLLNIQDINKKGTVKHYGTQQDLILEQNGKGYRIRSSEQAIDLKEAVWKINDTKYLLCADDIKIVFDKKDIRDAGRFIEINYIDEGVVQIVTQDNVWQSVSTSLYAKTSGGTVYRLFDQVIEVNKQRFPLTKLVIHSDDNVELSPLEVKNQQVPDIKVSSKDGTAGKSGSAGKEGTEGESGENGEQGEKGTQGTQGGSGAHGTQGSSGISGTAGSSGSSGGDGKSGSNGKGGTSGMNATQESSAKTGLPQFSFKNWEVSATAMSGTLQIEDENVMLSSESAAIVLYEAGSGEAIPCVNERGESDNFSVQGSEVFFRNDPDSPLRPDQEYRLVLRAKYEMSERSYEREFVSRVFYTDSLGILIREESVATDSITVGIEKKEYSKADHVELYLMKQSDGADITEDALNNRPHIGVDLEDGAQTERIVFKKEAIESILPNTEYVIRMKITAQGKEYLSQQALNVATLKRRPSINTDPYVIINRQFGGFELYGGKVIDEDHAIRKQYYEIYDADSDSGTFEQIVKTLEVAPSATNTATNLYMDEQTILANHKYTFRVTTIYNDNEKIVELHSKMSDVFSISPAHYPALSYEITDEEHYDYLHGNLIIDKNGSAIPISIEEPLQITIASEGVYNKTIMITDTADSGVIETDGQYIIPISESGLAQERIYRFTAIGYVDLKDGKKAQKRTIGNAVASTKPLTKLRADWKVSGDSSNAVARTLQLKGADDSWLDADHAYDANTLSKIVLELYSGSGSGRVFMKSIEYTDKDDDPHTSTLAEEFIQNGKEITEADFGYASSSLSSSVYTLRVKAVYDYTALEAYTANEGMVSGYKNEYTVENGEAIVAKASQPPALPDASLTDTMIISEPIYNEDAGAYGKHIDSSLDEQTIIGYKIRANYDNYAKLARTIDYYVFEANDYENFTKAGTNLLYDKEQNDLWPEHHENAHWVKRFTLDVSASSANVPTAAIFFGEGEDTTYYGMHILHAGDVQAENSGNLRSGMGRGYQYVFAYALGYNPTGAGEAEKLYPYEHPKYIDIANTDSIPYILNSGIRKAPKSDPQFTAYPYDSSSSGSTTSLEVRMRYSDPDHMITTGTDSKATQIYYGNRVAGTIEASPGEWQTVQFMNISVSQGGSGNVLAPKITRELYNEAYTSDADNQLEIFHLPLDLSNSFTRDKAKQLSYNLIANLDANMVEIQLIDTTGSGLLNGDMKRKIAGIKAIFTEQGNPENKVSMLLSVNNANRATVSTGRLEQLLGKRIEVQVELIYDTGEQGWKIGSESADMFALQTIASSSSTPKLNNYLTYFEASGILTRTQEASGSMFKAKEWLDLEHTDQPLQSKIYYLLRNETEQFTNTYKLVDNGISLTTVDPQGRDVIVPKRLAQHPVTSPAQNNTFDLDRIVPTLTMRENYEARLHSITLLNLDFIGTGRIDPDAAGRKFVTVEVKDKKANKVKMQKVDVTSWIKGSSLYITALQENTAYELKFKAVVNGQEMYLLDGSKSSNVVMSRDVTTKGTVTITNLLVNYQPETYETKLLQATYRLDQNNGFMIKYRILDEDGKEILSNQDMIEHGLYTAYTPGMAFSYQMEQTFSLRAGQHGLSSGVHYQLEVGTYLLDEDGEVEEDAISTMNKAFIIPEPATPIPFTNLTPQYDEASRQIDLNVEFSMADNDRVIMSDYGMEEGMPSHYFARVYEQEGSTWTDITKKKREPYDIFRSYTLQLKDLKPDTNYKLVLYAAIDRDMDGKADNKEDLTGSISSLSEEEFEKQKELYMIWEEVCATPGENGIAFGDVSIEHPNNDPTKLSIAYKNASNLTAIDKVDYTVISQDGKVSFGGSLEKNGDKDIFKLKASDVKGYYTMELPILLEEKKMYRIIIAYYQKQLDDSFKKLEPSYSTTYLYE